MRYTTTIEVQAWQYKGGGIVTKGAKELYDLLNTEPSHRDIPYPMHDFIRKAVAENGTWTPPEEGTMVDTLFWDEPDLGRQTCRAGDWIVCHEYGIEAINGAYFDTEFKAVES